MYSLISSLCYVFTDTFILGQLAFAVARTSGHCLIGLEGSKRRDGGQRGWKMRLEKVDKMRHGNVFNG